LTGTGYGPHFQSSGTDYGPHSQLTGTSYGLHICSCLYGY
jgi:hypothetical protein